MASKAPSADRPAERKLANLPPIIRKLLTARGYQTASARQAFLQPDYRATDYDPFLLPGMKQAVKRLEQARAKQQKVTIYCDYDVDGTASAAILLDALPRFGLTVDYYVPDRFKEGYGLNKEAINHLHDTGTDLVLTVDNGIVSFDEVDYANQLGLDMIITDHHSPRDTLPRAVAVVDPKVTWRDQPKAYDEHFCLRDRRRRLYPFLDLCGAGVAFKLVEALGQTFPADLPTGQEKWLLDLVAIATVSDIVTLADENRALVYWGLRVLQKTRRPGIKALVAVAGLDLTEVDSQAIGYMLGPRLNVAGRLASARLAIELLTATDNERALQLATELDKLNRQRKTIQQAICTQALEQVKADQPVAIAVGDGWHEGVIGIVASKVEEVVLKPTFIFSRHDELAKASGRSFGQFSIATAIEATGSLLIKGGGHAAAGGVTVRTSQLDQWCRAVNQHYRSLGLGDQQKYFYPPPDLTLDDFSELTPDLVEALAILEPYGQGNPVPTFLLRHVAVVERRLMGSERQHVKYTFTDAQGRCLRAIAFDGASKFDLMPGDETEPVYADALVELSLNEWRGNVSVEGKLIKLTGEDID